MALVVILKKLEIADGKPAERFCKISFRDNTQKSATVAGSDFYSFDQTFRWPIGRDLDEEDTLSIKVYSKQLTRSLYGTLDFWIRDLLYGSSDRVELTESLVDTNYALLRAQVTLEIIHHRPDMAEHFISGDCEHLLDEIGNDNRSRLGKLGSKLAAKFRPETNEMVRELTAEGTIVPEDEDIYKVIRNTGQTLELKNLSRVGPTIHRVEDFQLQITVIEARQLYGVNLNPYIELLVGDESKRTAVQLGTNSPPFNEHFCFDFNMPRSLVLDQVLQLRAYSKSNKMMASLFGGHLIGEFRMDLKTVWAAPGHVLSNKWTLLIDPHDASAGPRGYVKMHFNLLSKGEASKPPAALPINANKVAETIEDIESNLLTSSTVTNAALHKRQLAEISVKIYCAQDLPRMNTGFVSSLRTTLLGSDKPMLNALVTVTYSGHLGETRSVRGSHNPAWNEEVVFMDLFPPLCSRLRLSVMDSIAMGKNECIATHYIDLTQIMDAGQGGYLPTLGPTWINLYGRPRQYTYEHWLGHDEELDRGLGDGVSYRGRLLVALRTRIVTEMHQIDALTRPVAPVNPSALGDKLDLVLFAAIYETNVIDAQIGNGTPLRFELSCGLFGNALDSDAKAPLVIPNTDADAPALHCSSCTTETIALTSDKRYFHLPIERRKLCMHVHAQFEDCRKRMMRTNALARLSDFLEVKVDSLLAKLETQELAESIGNLRSAACAFARLAKLTLRNFKELDSVGLKTRTGLDKEREQAIELTLKKLKAKAVQIHETRIDPADRVNLQLRIKEFKSFIPIVASMLSEPEHTMPDVFLWLLAGNRRVAYVRIAARDLLHTELEEQRGRHCGKVSTHFMRKPGRRGTGKSGWAIQAQVKTYMWLGLNRDVAALKTGLPPNYQIMSDVCGLPREIVYRDTSMFQLRSYFYLARNLIGSDATGLSDPFARVILADKVTSSRVVNETLNPIWDQTLVLDKLTFYNCAAHVREDKPIVVVEVFDYDDDSTCDFLGRTFVTPSLVLQADSNYTVPCLQWSTLFRNQKSAGELLAAFELIELGKSDNSFPACYRVDEEQLKMQQSAEQSSLTRKPGAKADFRNEEIHAIPTQIRPLLAKYRLQVLFWGMRNMKKVQLSTVDSPRVELEWSGYVVRSATIRSMGECSNFPDPITYIDLELPQNCVYWPAITIRCFEKRQFGREVFAGSHVIANLTKYTQDQSTKRTKRTTRKDFVNSESADDLRNTENSKENKDRVPEAAPTELVTVVDETIQPSGYNFGTFRKKNLEKAGTRESRDGRNTGSLSAIIRSATGLSFTESAHTQHTERNRTQSINTSASDISSQLGVGMGMFGIGLAQVAGAVVNVAGAKVPEAPRVSVTEEMLRLRQRSLRKPSAQELEQMDWWSRYYAAVEIMQNDEENNGEIETIIATQTFREGDNMSMVNADKLLEGIEVQVQQHDEETTLEVPEGDVIFAKTKRKRFRKAKRREALKKRLAARSAAVRYQHEISGEENPGEMKMTQVEDPKSWIMKPVIYPCPLELVADFGGFTEVLITYPLVLGRASDEDDDNDQECVGELKGNLLISPILDDEYDQPVSLEDLSIGKGLPHSNVANVIVRVYVVCGISLAPADPNGKSDPYLVVQLGNGSRHLLNDHDRYIPAQLNPVFGRCFEFDAVFPRDSLLTITVMDFDLLSGDDEIGRTEIDLENRLLSKHYAMCGVASEYNMGGYGRWRDINTPSQILQRLCADHELPFPCYDHANYRVAIGDKVFYGTNEVVDEQGNVKRSKEPIALEAIRNFHSITGGWKTVPEHVETRPLFSEARPGIEQGRIQMWVDMFIKDLGTPPPVVDISPRQPKKYQLRVTVWNTDDVVLNDTSILTGEKSSDIYVKGWLNGADVDLQSTDVHYRSMTGEGNFNWRFVFNFCYMAAEDRITYKKKESPLALDEVEFKKPPVLFLQVWDADLIGSDNFLGTLELRLSKYPRPSKVAKSCGLHQFAKEVPQMSIFSQKRCKGWWPVINKTDETDEDEVTGKIEAEMFLLTAEEAEISPAGFGRNEPEPLAAPNRPESKIFSFLNPWKVVKHLILKYKWFILKALSVILLGLFIFLLFYTSPGAITQKIING